MGSKLCKGTLLFFVAGGHLVLWRHGFETSQGNTPLQILEPARLCQGCWQPDSGPFPVMLPNIAGRGPGWSGRGWAVLMQVPATKATVMQGKRCLVRNRLGAAALRPWCTRQLT